MAENEGPGKISEGFQSQFMAMSLYAKRFVVRTVFPVEIANAMLEGLASAMTGPQSETFERGLNVLRRHVPFDGAWWGLIDGPPDMAVEPVFHLAGYVGLSDELCKEYSEICTQDTFAEAVVTHPGQVLRWTGRNEEAAPELNDWVERHHLAHGAALCSHTAFSCQALVVVFYRFTGAAAFTDEEALAMPPLVRQLEMLWERSLKDIFRCPSTEALADALLAKSDGTLIYCGANMAKHLAAMGWDRKGQKMPQSLLRHAPLGGRVRVADGWLVVSSDEGVIRAQLASGNQLTSMPTRILRVASLICNGMTAKEVARELDLSPSTVRTYVREAYSRLGVHNKLELAELLKPLR